MRVTVLRSNEDGAVAVFFAVIVTALLAMTALVVDVGSMMVMKRRVVAAADASALAGALSCALVSGDVSGQGSTVGAENLVGATNPSISAGEQGCATPMNSNSIRRVTATASADAELYFAHIFGGGSWKRVSASATATVGPATVLPPVPFMVDVNAWTGCNFPNAQPASLASEVTCDLLYDNDDIGKAQWGLLNLFTWSSNPSTDCSSAGSSTYKDWVTNPKDLTVDPIGGTYVCGDTGLRATVWEELNLPVNAGQVKYFPVTQRDGSAVGDRYQVLGYTPLRIISSAKSGSAITLRVSWPGPKSFPRQPKVQAREFGARTFWLTS